MRSVGGEERITLYTLGINDGTLENGATFDQGYVGI
jgi:hypothetical protein